MASIFDQYEASLGRGTSSQSDQPPARVNLEPKPSNYSAMRVADETPIFTRTKVFFSLFVHQSCIICRVFLAFQINFKPTGAITHLSINNNKLCMITEAKTLLRIDLEKPNDITEVRLHS